MEVYRRYFRVTDGPIFDHITEAKKINAKANEQYEIILTEIGAELQYYHHGHKMVGLLFEDEPDKSLFKKRKRGGWWPKKNCKAGKELIARIQAVETKDPNDALRLVGLANCPTIFGGTMCYRPTLVIIPEASPVAYISVPWYDESPKKLEQYKKDRSARTHYNANLDALFWEPTPNMEEVKKWEMDKHIEEYNESIKKAA